MDQKHKKRKTLLFSLFEKEKGATTTTTRRKRRERHNPQRREKVSRNVYRVALYTHIPGGSGVQSKIKYIIQK